MKKVIKAVLIVLATICFVLSAYYDVAVLGITAGGLLFSWVPFGIVPGGYGVLALRGLLLLIGIGFVLGAVLPSRAKKNKIKKIKGAVKMKSSKPKKVKIAKVKKVRGRKGKQNIIVAAPKPAVAPAVEPKKKNTAIKF